MVRGVTSTTIEGTSHALTWVVALFWASCLLPAHASKQNPPYLQQSFFFDWTPPDQSPPVPTTAQCESIHITWDRGNAVGPNPTAPYYLQIYTSTFVVPLIVPAGDSDTQLSFDFPVPWIPGTQYEICMFDKNGFTGGCQATYTVYQAPNTTLDSPPVCRNLTYPQPNQVLDVDGQVNNGPLSQFGWVDQCTDIMLTPKNGTPPFTMTIAPALHPPYNITSNSMSPINWTVALSYGSPFFISLADSAGNTWANGPLHSGGGGTTECLSQTDSSITTLKKIKFWVAAVTGVAGVVIGFLVGMLGACLLLKLRRRRKSVARPDMLQKSSSMSVTEPVLEHGQNYSDNPPDQIVTHQRLRDGPYQIEPFVMPGESEFGGRNSAQDRSTVYDSFGRGHSHTRSLSQGGSRSGSVISPTSGTTPSTSTAPLVGPSRPLSSQGRNSSQIYVVHNDSGRAPVTVYAADGTEVVELPPRYNDSSVSTTGASSTGGSTRAGPLPPLQVQDKRQPGPPPPKLPPRRVVN